MKFHTPFLQFLMVVPMLLSPLRAELQQEKSTTDGVAVANATVTTLTRKAIVHKSVHRQGFRKRCAYPIRREESKKRRSRKQRQIHTLEISSYKYVKVQ